MNPDLNTSILLLGAYAAGAASGVGAMYLYRPRPLKPIPSDWMPRALEFNKAVQAEIKANAKPGKPYVTGLRSPFAPKPRAKHWLAKAEAKAADAALDALEGQAPALEPSRSKNEPTSPRSILPSIGWGTGKPDAQ